MGNLTSFTIHMSLATPRTMFQSHQWGRFMSLAKQTPFLFLNDVYWNLTSWGSVSKPDILQGILRLIHTIERTLFEPILIYDYRITSVISKMWYKGKLRQNRVKQVQNYNFVFYEARMWMSIVVKARKESFSVQKNKQLHWSIL